MNIFSFINQARFSSNQWFYKLYLFFLSIKSMSLSLFRCAHTGQPPPVYPNRCSWAKNSKYNRLQVKNRTRDPFLTWDEGLVAAVELGHRLLNERNPQLFSLRLPHMYNQAWDCIQHKSGAIVVKNQSKLDPDPGRQKRQGINFWSAKCSPWSLQIRHWGLRIEVSIVLSRSLNSFSKRSRYATLLCKHIFP